MFQKLLQNTETMADLMEQTMPELPVEGEIFTNEKIVSSKMC